MKWPKHEFPVEQNTVLAGYMGSQSHGTYVKPQDGGIDDKDVMGIIIPPSKYLIGLSGFECLNQWVDEYDLVFYDIRKFLRLLLKNNPNVLGLLWLPDNLYIKRTEAGQDLIASRDIFSSREAYYSFTGYAHGQLKRMTHLAFEGYMGEKRKALVQKWGYDTKNAAHLIRLLRMGIEFISTGELRVQRHDATQLIDIKQGKYKLEEIQAMAEDLFKVSQEALVRSPLPPKPDFFKAEKLLMQIIERALDESRSKDKE